MEVVFYFEDSCLTAVFRVVCRVFLNLEDLVLDCV